MLSTINLKGFIASRENSGRHIPHKKTKEMSVKIIREHIESFPLDPHYTRRDTNRKFLGYKLNIKKMYHLYQDKCQNIKARPVSAAKYRKIFNEEYNYSFHIHKCFRL